MKKYPITKINSEILGRKILPKDLKELNIEVVVTDAGLTLHFSPNINELQSFICFLKEETDCVQNAFKLIKDVKEKLLTNKIETIVSGDESISEYIVELEEHISFSKKVLKEFKNLEKED